MEHSSITKLDQATRMLAEVRTIDDAKQIIHLAEAARVYAKQVELGLEAQNHAAEIKLRAQRKAGEILDGMEKAKGAAETGWKTRSQPVTTLEDMGINKMDASRWQTIAAMPEEKFEEFIAETTGGGGELTTAGILRTAKLEIAKENKFAPPELAGKYRVIYADPPWEYGDPLVVDGYKVSASIHYPTMSLKEICALPITELSDDNSVLFLWATSPMIREAFEVAETWGFEYKASFIWDKVKHNWGHYNSVRHELLLICTRGSCMPDVPELIDSVQSIERNGHSEKPEEFRAIIDKLYPGGKRIELFARRAADGWETWGNELITASTN